MKVILRVWFAVCFAVLMAGAAHAAVINFDDISPNASLTGTGYAGLTWGTSTDDVAPTHTGEWWVYNDSSYATPQSSPNYVINWFGPNNLSFTFPSPVTFDGAWFAIAGSVENHRATEVRAFDDLGHVSGWLTLANTPQFLSANFAGSTTISVERQGGIGGEPAFGNARWFTMDDITYNGAPQVPEPTTMLLLGLGLVGLLGIRRKFKK